MAAVCAEVSVVVARVHTKWNTTKRGRKYASHYACNSLSKRDMTIKFRSHFYFAVFAFHGYRRDRLKVSRIRRRRPYFFLFLLFRFLFRIWVPPSILVPLCDYRRLKHVLIAIDEKRMSVIESLWLVHGSYLVFFREKSFATGAGGWRS